MIYALLLLILVLIGVRIVGANNETQLKAALINELEIRSNMTYEELMGLAYKDSTKLKLISINETFRSTGIISPKATAILEKVFEFFGDIGITSEEFSRLSIDDQVELHVKCNFIKIYLFEYE